jgi:2-keto-4-pentenoate hydratase
MTLKLDIDCPDALRVAHDYEQVGERCTDLKRPFREAADLLEHVHERGFARLRGRYVLTGATRSATPAAPGSCSARRSGTRTS